MRSGIIHKLNVASQLVVRYCLYRVFRFHRWHVIPLAQKAYAVDIIQRLNARPAPSRKVVYEIGCGVGDILRHLDYDVRVGFDRERNVLRCAAFLAHLSGKKSAFHVFDFPAPLPSSKADAVIMVNWIHRVAPDVLKEYLSKYFRENLAESGLIVIDTVEAEEYRYHHELKDLVERLECDTESFGPYGNGRWIHIVRKHETTGARYS